MVFSPADGRSFAQRPPLYELVECLRSSHKEQAVGTEGGDRIESLPERARGRWRAVGWTAWWGSRAFGRRSRWWRPRDGHGRLELTKFHAPSGRGGDRHAPANTPGIRHVAFAVDDMDAVVASLRARGAELVGEVERYEDSYRLCYVRGPEGIIVELAEQIG